MSVDVATLEELPAESAVAARPKRAARRQWARLTLRAGVTVLVLALGAALAVRVFHIGQPNTPDYSATLEPPSPNHLFGTDALGRDIFVRMLYATFTDFRVGVIATAVPLAIGLVIGGVAGYARGWVGAGIMRAIEFVQAFPSLIFILAVVAVVGPGLTGIYFGLIITGIPGYTRITRGEMLVLREQQFILAARTLGFSWRRIVFRHGLPHLLRPGLVYSISDVLNNVLALAALSYLGFGVQPPTPEWGALIADGQTYLLNSWWITTLPGLFVVVVGLGFSLTGEALAERLHVHLTGRG